MDTLDNTDVKAIFGDGDIKVGLLRDVCYWEGDNDGVRQAGIAI